MKEIRVLHIVSSLSLGGVEKLLYNYYININNHIKFDIIVHGTNVGILEKKFTELGVKIYHVTPRKKSIFKNCIDIIKIISSNHYDIVHSHINEMSFIPLFIATMLRVKNRIAHSHGCKQYNNIFQKIKHRIFVLLCLIFANYFFACSKDAAIWNFGKKKYEKGKVNIIYNAINFDLFIYNDFFRRKIRNDLKIINRFILIQVGRIIGEKNYEFTLKIMKEIVKQKKDVTLLIVGDGPEKTTLLNIVKNYELTDYVVFLGEKENVNELLCAADVFLMPSKSEGLGIAAIEAQVNGLVCLVSDALPEDVKISDRLVFIDINDVNKWVEKILNIPEYNRYMTINNDNYDIKKATEKLEFLYYCMI